MKHFFKLAALVVTFVAQPAVAQERADTVGEGTLEEVREIFDRSGIVPAIDSIAAQSGPELEQALEQLAATLGVLAERIASDPALRASALRTAEGVVELAQVVVAEQSEALLEILRTAAEEASAPVQEEPEPRVR